MDKERIESALEKATDTHAVVIGPGVTAQTGALFTQNFAGKRAVVVADERTFAVAGEAVKAALADAGVEAESAFVFPGTPTLYAGHDRVTELADALAQHDALPVAIGSGTLNDITKLAAHQLDRPYLCVATAASMDGYTASGASITKDGFKQTFACPAPRVVVADTEILAGAPLAMTAAGYADLLGKVTAGADWLIADALGIELIEPWSWGIVQGSLRGWLANPEKLADGDKKAFGRLIEGLVLTGLAMQDYGNSRPASGSEHQFSHLWEMAHVGADREPPLSHGFKVGLGSIAIAALYEALFAQDLTQIAPESIVEHWPSSEALAAQIRATHPEGIQADRAVEESLAKHLSPEELNRRIAHIQQLWPTLKPRLEQRLMPPGEIRQRLVALGAPTDPGEIGVDRNYLRRTYFQARQIRRRYTVLDLAAETGVLEKAVAELDK